MASAAVQRAEGALADDWHVVRVPLGDRAYEVVIGEGLLVSAGRHLKALGNFTRAFIVTDASVGALYAARLKAALQAEGIEPVVTDVADGETSKAFDTLTDVLDAMLAHSLERGDLVVALGGGVVGDLAGFAAAIALRGLPFVQLPTSLLAQVDSAVGGKTGINTRHGKNLVGAFHQPRLVLCDTGVLTTLPVRERRAGYAEVVKIGLIGDAAFYARLETLGERAPFDALATSIATAVAAKAAIVAADEREGGQRALLNLGHTFAHGVERCAGYDGRIVHGEAVGLGLALAFRLSARLGHSSPDDAERVAHHLHAVGLPTRFADLPLSLEAHTLLNAMKADKKVERGRLRLILVRGIGAAFLTDTVSEDELLGFLVDEGLPAR